MNKTPFFFHHSGTSSQAPNFHQQELIGTVKLWDKFALVQFYGYLENELYSILWYTLSALLFLTFSHRLNFNIILFGDTGTLSYKEKAFFLEKEGGYI